MTEIGLHLRGAYRLQDTTTLLDAPYTAGHHYEESIRWAKRTTDKIVPPL